MEKRLAILQNVLYLVGKCWSGNSFEGHGYCNVKVSLLGVFGVCVEWQRPLMARICPMSAWVPLLGAMFGFHCSVF